MPDKENNRRRAERHRVARSVQFSRRRQSPARETGERGNPKPQLDAPKHFLAATLGGFPAPVNRFFPGAPASRRRVPRGKFSENDSPIKHDDIILCGFVDRRKPRQPRIFVIFAIFCSRNPQSNRSRCLTRRRDAGATGCQPANVQEPDSVFSVRVPSRNSRLKISCVSCVSWLIIPRVRHPQNHARRRLSRRQ